MSRGEISSARGSLEVVGDYATITFVREIAHPPAAVWSAITEPEEMAQWFMSTLKLEARAGGTVQLVSGPSQFHSIGKVLIWEPMRIFEYEWKVQPRAELPLGENAIVRWELSSTENGTKLQVRYKKLTKQTALGFLPGMHVFLDRLQAQLEKANLPTWSESFPRIQALYPEWKPVGQFK